MLLYCGINVFENVIDSSNCNFPIISHLQPIYDSSNTINSNPIISASESYSCLALNPKSGQTRSMIQITGFICGKRSQKHLIEVPFTPAIKQTFASANAVTLLTEDLAMWSIDTESLELRSITNFSELEMSECGCQRSTNACDPETGSCHCPRVRIVKLQSGLAPKGGICLAISANGFLYNIPHRIFNDFLFKIVDIAQGYDHALILTESGQVYSWGNGSRGQLGHENLENESYPRLIQALDGIVITHISAGGWHSLALSGDNIVYAWGWNTNGQLGQEPNADGSEVCATPTVVNFPENPECSIVRISCGIRHSLALTDESELYGCGSNKFGQLSLDPKFINVYEMRGIEINKERVKDIQCSPYGTFVFTK